MAILCLDFDGVLHSYTSGWKGPRTIPDPPVDGALEFLARATNHFDVHIHSSRSNYFLGRRTMKRWLIGQYLAIAPTLDETPTWLRNIVFDSAFSDSWGDEVRFAVRKLVNRVRFSRHKPPAMLTIDDRALTFTGAWPDIDELKRFKPWNGKAAV